MKAEVREERNPFRQSPGFVHPAGKAMGAVAGVGVGCVTAVPGAMLGAALGAPQLALVGGIVGFKAVQKSGIGDVLGAPVDLVASGIANAGNAALCGVVDLELSAEDTARLGRAGGDREGGGYQVGDWTRGIVRKGRVTRGGEVTTGSYRFGDFTRGIFSGTGSLEAAQAAEKDALAKSGRALFKEAN